MGKINENYIYILTCMLFLDKLRVKCESFRGIESEMVKLFEVLVRHTACHLFRSSHLNLKETTYLNIKMITNVVSVVQ